MYDIMARVAPQKGFGHLIEPDFPRTQVSHVFIYTLNE